MTTPTFRRAVLAFELSYYATTMSRVLDRYSLLLQRSIALRNEGQTLDAVSIQEEGRLRVCIDEYEVMQQEASDLGDGDVSMEFLVRMGRAVKRAQEVGKESR